MVSGEQRSAPVTVSSPERVIKNFGEGKEMVKMAAVDGVMKL